MTGRNPSSFQDLLVLVPARAGSKRISNKNERLLGGSTLIDRTLRVIDELGLQSDAIISSDIPGLEHRYPAWTVRKRPAHLGGDDVTMEAVVIDALDSVQSEAEDPTWLLLLQPTSPFRRAQTIRDCLARLQQSSAEIDAVMTVNKTFEDLWVKHGELLSRLRPEQPRSQQEREPLWIENGSCYAVRVSALREKKRFDKMTIVGWETDPAESLDVNTEMDLKFADWLAEMGAEDLSGQ